MGDAVDAIGTVNMKAAPVTFFTASTVGQQMRLEWDGTLMVASKGQLLPMIATRPQLVAARLWKRMQMVRARARPKGGRLSRQASMKSR